MPRRLMLCTTIVAAFQLHPAAASPNIVDAVVAPSVAALALRLGLDPARDRARFLPEITRLLYTPLEGKQPALDLMRPSRAAGPQREAVTGGQVRVPVPLGPEIWSRVIFRRPIALDDLLTSILIDRRAALLCRGLFGLDDETLAYVAERPPLLALLYEQGAPAFATLADAFHVVAGRVVPAGGDAAARLWEGVLRERVTTPDRFARALFGEFEGRRAYLYAAIASAEPAAAAFALGLWLPDESVRAQRFQALADGVVHGYREWHLGTLPFSRPLNDIAVLLLRVRVDGTGAPLPPASRRLWSSVFDISDDGAAVIDAAWLVDATAGEDMYSRGDRLDVLAFAQRVFAETPTDAVTDVTATLRNFRQARMLLLTLDRLGIRTPAVYASMLTAARALGDGAGSARRFWTHAQFQGAMALVARMQRVGTITPAQGESLVRSLAAVKLASDGTFAGGIAAWIRSDLGRILPPGDSWEERAVAALAGPETPSMPRVFWEGQAYRIDAPFAERRRLAIIRDKQGGHTLDVGLAIDAVARTVAAPAASADSMRAAAAALKDIGTESGARLQRPAVNLVPAGVDPPRDGVDWISKASDELGKAARAGDLRRGPRVASSLHDLADIIVGDALLSLAYAADLGDPDGSPLLAGNVALRHDFGFARKETAARDRTPWAMPRQDFMPGVPWHVTGSLLGLDIALAPLALRRAIFEGAAEAPKLTSVEREGFAVGVSLMDSSRLVDADRDAIASAVAMGRERIGKVAAGAAEPLDGITVVLSLDGWRRRSLAWMLQNDRAAVPDQFSLAELLALGGGAPTANLDAWGAPGTNLWACVCTRFPSPRMWSILAGRPQVPLMAASFVDLQLRLAMLLAERKLPSALARAVLASAMQEFIDAAAPTDPNDWWSLSREARTLARQRFEDYVAAAAAIDGPLVPEETGSPR